SGSPIPTLKAQFRYRDKKAEVKRPNPYRVQGRALTERPKSAARTRERSRVQINGRPLRESAGDRIRFIDGKRKAPQQCGAFRWTKKKGFPDSGFATIESMPQMLDLKTLAARPENEVLEDLKTSRAGLSVAEAASRLKEYGQNEFTQR